MSIRAKKLLLIITYYTLIGLAIIMAGGFVLALAFRAYPFWAKIIYYIWAGVVIATIIFDIVCTATNRMKFISGMIIYVLSLSAIAMSVIIYLVNTTRTGLGTDLGPVFNLVTALSYATTLFMIAEYIVGEFLIDSDVASAERQRRIKE